MAKIDIERWRRVEAILDVALELEPAARADYVRQAAGGDPGLLADVERMLAGAEADLFLEVPAAAFAADLFDVEAEEDLRDLEGTHVGPYRLVRKLGHGGMGVVYLAERADGQFEQRVALKLIKRGMDSDDIQRRFRAERQVLAHLNHPHIARLFDGGVSAEGQPWFAMEYVNGHALNRYCEEHRLGIDERLGLFHDVCEAVQFAHQNLVVHRDLKPSNILVTSAGEVKLVDFGIAKVLQEEAEEEALTHTELRRMTPEYAAPEQVRGEAVTTATDVYALGAVLYELLTGRQAHRFSARTPAETERVICEVEPEPPSAVVRGTPQARRLKGDLDLIVLKALRKDPARRYHSVEALLEDLDNHRTGRPVRARPDSAAYRTRKFLGRHRYVVAGAVTLFLALAAGLGGTLWQARATAREAAKAREVKDFVLSLFRVSKPEVARGREITARELLARGASRIDTGLARQPELQVELLGVLGVIHRDLGMYPEADSLLRRAVQVSSATYGEANPVVAARLMDWSSVLAARGDYDRADSMLVRAHRIVAWKRGPEDTAVATALGALASVRRLRGEFVQAESLYRDALRIDRDQWGADPLRVAEDLDNLGLVQEDAGNFPGADSSYAEALALRRTVLDPDHPQVITSLLHLATLREKQGEFEEAIRLEREVVERRRRVYPSGHPEVAYALQTLATTLQIQGEYTEAESLIMEAIAILRARLGPDHPETIQLVSDLATLKYSRGDLRGAEAEFRVVLAGWQRSLGPEHPTTLQALNDLAAVLKYQRRYAEAEPLHREALAMRRRRLGETHPSVAESWGNLAELFLDKGDPIRAEKAYREALAIYRATLPPGHVFIAGSLMGVGGALTDQGRAAEAEPLLREALDIRIASVGVGDRRTARAQRLLGHCLLKMGRRAEAEPLLVRSYNTLSEAEGWYYGLVKQQALEDLVELYRSWGKPGEAARYRALLAGRGG